MAQVHGEAAQVLPHARGDQFPLELGAADRAGGTPSSPTSRPWARAPNPVNSHAQGYLVYISAVWEHKTPIEVYVKFDDGYEWAIPHALLREKLLGYFD